MKIFIEIVLFIAGGLFFNASQVLSWLMGAGKPEAPSWKTYLTISLVLWGILFYFANS